MAEPHQLISQPLIELTLPASKSITNRWLVLERLSEGLIKVEHPSASSDSEFLRRLLYDPSPSLNAGDGGTTFRFLLASLACQPGRTVVLDGSPRMRERPVRELVDALIQLGAHVEYVQRPGHAPLRVTGSKLNKAVARVDVSRSSQFASALLLIAAFLPQGMSLTLEGDPVSISYIDMTLAVLRQAGIEYQLDGPVIHVPAQKSNFCTVHPEADWSSAAFWFAYIATHPDGKILLKGLHKESIQGDCFAHELFTSLGVSAEEHPAGIVLRNIGFQATQHVLEFDLSSTPDLFPAFAVAAFALRQPVRISGISHLRYKESDRLEIVTRYLREAGAEVVTTDGQFMLIGFQETPSSDIFIDPHGDHRIAMAFGILRGTSFRFHVLHPETVSKSYPGFWDDLNRVEASR